MRTTDDGLLHLLAEGESARPLRAVHVPLDPALDGGAGTLLMFDQQDNASLANSTNVQALLEILPIGLALVDRDGRFLTMNKAFHVAAGIGDGGSRRPTPAISSPRRTRPRSPTRCGATRAARRCRATFRSASSATAASPSR